MHKRSLLVAAALLLAGSTAWAAELAVIGHPGASPLGRDDVADLFLGKRPGYVLIDLPDTSPLYAEFYRKATRRDVAQVKAAWARLVFSGRARAPRQLPDAAAVKKAVAADPQAVGYIEKSEVDGSVKVLLTLD